MSLDSSPRSQSRFGGLIACSELMIRAVDQAERAALVDSTVLITGESGTGKELIAKAIHQSSRRTRGPFVAINMAALPETLVESELFGHIKGAYTGAETERVGRFAAADGGTLFIDEIGDLKLSSQAKLLRVLENHRVTPIGSNRETAIDVRVVAATSRDLSELVSKESFRQDLYYRLNVVNITLPPLRDRPEDIPLLIDHFLNELSAAARKARPVPDAELMEFLMTYDWPGNVRQLRHCLESMVVLSAAQCLSMENLPSSVRSRGSRLRIDVPVGATLEELQMEILRQTVKRCAGNRTRAAQALGISLRTLQRKLKRSRHERNGNGHLASSSRRALARV